MKKKLVDSYTMTWKLHKREGFEYWFRRNLSASIGWVAWWIMPEIDKIQLKKHYEKEIS